jgi:diaminopimelate decarboxylase
MTLSEIVRPIRHQAVDIQPDALHLCRLYRKAFAQDDVSFPASGLKLPGAAKWVSGHGLAVDVYSNSELALAISAGIRPARMVVHGDEAGAPTIAHAVQAGVRRFVVGSPESAAALVEGGTRTAHVLVDRTTWRVEDAASAIDDRLTLIGLHGRLDPRAIGPMVGDMAQVWRNYGSILTCLSLASDDVDGLPGLAAAVDDELDEACARWRFPRPVLVLGIC